MLGGCLHTCLRDCDTCKTSHNLNYTTHTPIYPVLIPSHAALWDKPRLRVSGVCSCSRGGNASCSTHTASKYIQNANPRSAAHVFFSQEAEHMAPLCHQLRVCLGSFTIFPVVGKCRPFWVLRVCHPTLTREVKQKWLISYILVLV